MAFDFKFPDIGEGISEGELVSWKIKEGDIVTLDQPIADIETDKAIVAIPSPRAGKILKLHFNAGDTVPVGAVLVTIGETSEEVIVPIAQPKVEESNVHYDEGVCVNGICLGGPCVCPTPNPEFHEEEQSLPQKRKDAGAVVGQLPEYEEVASHQYFFLKNGEEIKSLAELRNKLRQIDNETFMHHVNEYRNDFSNWIRDVIKSQALAERVAQAVTKEKMLSVLSEHPNGEVKIMPGIRALAKQRGVDLSTIKPSGAANNITKEDVENAFSQQHAIEKKESLGPGIKITKRDFDLFGYIEKIPMRGMRKTIARNMERSTQRTAAVTAFDEADITSLYALRKREKSEYEAKGIKMTFLPYLMKACINALKDHPYLNGTMDDETQEIVLKKYYNFGIAVDTPEGLTVPVLKIADKKSMEEIAIEIEKLVNAAKERKLDLADMKGGTFTISNIGSIGTMFATPIINYPEFAILLTGRIYEKPVVVDGAIEIRKILPLSLTYDHRIVDGADAARFMNDLIKNIEGLKF